MHFIDSKALRRSNRRRHRRIHESETLAQLRRVHAGWLIKGPGITPLEPHPELQEHRYRLENTAYRSRIRRP